MKPAILSVLEQSLNSRGIAHGALELMAIKANADRRGKITFYVFEGRDRRPSRVMKLARTDQGRGALRRERAVYSELLERSSWLRSRRPRIYYDGPLVTFVLETFIPGGQTLARFGSPEHEDIAVQWLKQFQSAHGQRQLGNADLLNMLRPLCRSARAEGIRNLADSLQARAGALDTFQLNDVPVHGDFTNANVLIEGAQGDAIDWEWARLSGWPFEDICLYLIDAARRVDTDSSRGMHNVPGTVDTLSGQTWYSRRMRQVLFDFADDGGYPRRLVAVFCLATMFQRAFQNREEHVDWREGRAGVYMQVLSRLEERVTLFWRFWEPAAGEG